MRFLLANDRSRLRGVLMLACAIWGLHALIEMASVGQFTILLIDGDPLRPTRRPVPAWLGVLWAAHGLALMLIMSALLDRAWYISNRGVRLAAVVSAPVVFALVQSVLALLSAQYFMGDDLGTAVAAGMDALRGNLLFHEAPSAAGIQFGLNLKHNFRTYIWLFGFYTVSAGFVRAARSSYEARLEAQEARLDALRLQIAPHFLFNALNALSALVASGRDRDAEAMIGRLSDFYRSTLLATDGDLAPLEQELDAIHDYLEIERVRFGERLQVSFDVAEGLDGVRVPTLILQPLVENAMKHGVARTGAPVLIRITAHSDGGRLVLGVANGLPKSEAEGAPRGTGSGLPNIRRRLAALFGPTADLATSRSNGEWIAVVSLPRSPGPVSQ